MSDTGDYVPIIISLVSLFFSFYGLYIGIYLPHRDRPKLFVSIDERTMQRSDPTSQGDTPSWFYRLRIENKGVLPAKDCVGRLLRVCADSEVCSEIDPLNLYWARQNKHNKWQPVTIQGNGDYIYLDIAQFKSRKNKDGQEVFQEKLYLRIEVPDNEELVQGNCIVQDDSDQNNKIHVRNLEIDYFLLIGIYSQNDAHVVPTWFKLEYLSNHMDDEPPYKLRKCYTDENIPCDDKTNRCMDSFLVDNWRTVNM